MNLLITGAWKNARKYLKQIEQMGNTVRFLQYENEELPCNYDWVEGVICNGLFVHHPIENSVNKCRVRPCPGGICKKARDTDK